MKIEMGESLMLSWARHVKHCQIATLNWKPSRFWQSHNYDKLESLINDMKATFSSDVFGNTGLKLLP